jgi:type IV pilus assembly protein PilM
MMATTTLTGVDIGSTSVRAIQTSRGKGHPVVTNFGQVPIPFGAVRGGVINDEKIVTAALKTLWSEHKFRKRDVVVGVTSHQIVVREMSLPNLPPREFKQALPFQVRDLLPMPLDKALLDFYPLEDPKKNETVRGLLIAAPKEIVLTTVRAVERAGLHVVRVDLASFALLRAAGRVGVQVEALADIGAHATTLVIHVDGVPRIVRTLPRGGADVTEAIAARLKIPLQEAEDLKCRVGLLPSESPEVQAAVRDAMRSLISELRSSFAYLASGGESAARVASLALCGGSARLPGLVDTLHEELGVPVFLADPLMRVSESKGRGSHDELGLFRSSATVSIGLALAAAA